ncbi:hypothetical protein HMI55_007408 [Coelomomyces lativittatus]|nr:hypothetical protein HMI56_002041 [Coelomomyces lativittatus]KAJ1509366.1 hypothetical protein HMI55_007408 [Coelomomyces lativittatus]
MVSLKWEELFLFSCISKQTMDGCLYGKFEEKNRGDSLVSTLTNTLRKRLCLCFKKKRKYTLFFAWYLKKPKKRTRNPVPVYYSKEESKKWTRKKFFFFIV